MVSVVSLGGPSTLWTFSSPILSDAGIDTGKFLAGDSAGVDNTLTPPSQEQIDMDDDVNPGDAWSVLAGNGLTFVGGGGVAPTSGTVS